MSNNHSTLFVTEKWIKNNTPLQSNVEFTNLRPVLRYIQDSKIQMVLGTPLYRRLQDEVAEKNENPSHIIPEDYKLLLDDFIVHIMAHGFMAEAPVDLLIKYMNSTVGTTTPDNHSSVSLNQVKFLQEQHKGRSQFYIQRLIDYICFNTEKYPEYLQGKEDDIRPTKKAYSGNINTTRLPKSKLSRELRYDGAIYDIKRGRWNYE